MSKKDQRSQTQAADFSISQVEATNLQPKYSNASPDLLCISPVAKKTASLNHGDEPFPEAENYSSEISMDGHTDSDTEGISDYEDNFGTGSKAQPSKLPRNDFANRKFLKPSTTGVKLKKLDKSKKQPRQSPKNKPQIQRLISFFSTNKPQDIKASKKEGAVHKDSFKPKIQVETQPKADIKERSRLSGMDNYNRRSTRDLINLFSNIGK